MWKGFKNGCIVAAAQATDTELLAHSLPLCPVFIDSSSSMERVVFVFCPRPVIIEYLYVKSSRCRGSEHKEEHISLYNQMRV